MLHETHCPMCKNCGRMYIEALISHASAVADDGAGGATAWNGPAPCHNDKHLLCDTHEEEVDSYTASVHDGESYEPVDDHLNEVEQGRWDDDPSPYDGTYSED